MLGVGNLFGYTIIEVMIFLAVFGAIFVSAAALINGRQERTLFQQSVNTMAQNVEDILNDVSTGYYPSFNNFRCTNTPSFSLLPGTTGQGKNEDCIFSGKLIKFSTSPASSKYDIYTMTSNKPDLSSAGTSPKISDPAISTLLLGGPNFGVSESKTNNVDLVVTKLTDGANSYNSLAIVSDFGFNSSAGILTANATRTKLYWYRSNPDLVHANTKLVSTDFVEVSPAQTVTVCLQQGTGAVSNSKKAFLTISPQMTVTREISGVGPGC